MPSLEYLDAIRTVYTGNAVLAPRDLTALLDGNFRRSEPPTKYETLTDKERDVFAAVSRGLAAAGPRVRSWHRGNHDAR